MEGEKKYPCPLCGSPNQLYDEREYDICHVCGWEDDPIQRKYHDDIGANKMTFNEARATLQRGEKIYPDFPKE